MSKSSAKLKRLSAYNDIIVRNKARFAAGMSLTRKEFVELFGIQGIVNKGSYKKVHKSNLRLVAVQKEINILMRENGLYMQSRDYYSEFLVQEKDRTKDTILRYSYAVDKCASFAGTLETAMVERTNAGNWGTYKKVNLKKTEIDVQPSLDHMHTVAVVDTI